MWALRYEGTEYAFDQVLVTSLQVEGRSYRVDDAPNPRADGVTHGEDFADPGDVKLKLLISFQSVRNLTMQRMMLSEAANAFLKSWDAAALRSVAGAAGELVVPTLGLFVGRPRRAEFDFATYGLGYLEGTATFVRSDLQMYALNEDGVSAWKQATLTLVSSQAGGLKSPLRAPLRTTVESTRARTIEVGGDTPTSGVYEISGPVQSNAQLECPGRWRLYLNRALAYDQTATVDTRPGHAATFINGVPVQVLDPRSSLLEECTLLPGPNVLALRGSSIEGTASVQVRWRDARGGL